MTRVFDQVDSVVENQRAWREPLGSDHILDLTPAKSEHPWKTSPSNATSQALERLPSGGASLRRFLFQ